MSAATIDRYLAPVKAPIRGKTTTKPGALLRNSISVRKAGDEVEAEPGFLEIGTVAHCGPSLAGEFARTVNFTDMHTGRVFTRAIRDNAMVHIVTAFDEFITAVPIMVTGIDSDNGSLKLSSSIEEMPSMRSFGGYYKSSRLTASSKSLRKTSRLESVYIPSMMLFCHSAWILRRSAFRLFQPIPSITAMTN